MPTPPTASIIIPTRGRPGYLEFTLDTVMPQARDAGAEVIVVDDGADEQTGRIAQRAGARLVAAPAPGGLNIARNAGAHAAGGELLVLIDDDVAAPPGWLDALLAGAAAAPDHDVFGGPIRARLEGGGPRRCGREGAPITTLDLGASDREAEVVWGSNMALRRRALERAGPFDPSLSGPGDEEEWEQRFRAAGGRIRYLAQAGLEHRRSAIDSTLTSLSRAAYGQGRAARQFDVRRQVAPSLMHELRTLAGCLWHIVRRRCLNGIVMTAHTTGRLREALSP